MIKRFSCTFITFVLCSPCFAEELPSVPELLKRMYDYRMAIDNIRVEVTVTKPVCTQQRHRETETQRFFFAYDKGRVRCDKTYTNPKFPQDWFYQDLSTQDFYFTRHPAGSSASMSEINDGNNLYLLKPHESPIDTFDPRRIGTDRNTFDIIFVSPFNYDTLLDQFYPAKAENFDVSIDLVDGEKLYKISYQFADRDITNSYWLNPQKGYNLVQSESGSNTLGSQSSYAVALSKHSSIKGDVWFPQEIVRKQKTKSSDFEERIILNSVAFDVQDETQFSLAGLGIPIGYRVYDGDGGKKFWDGKELVDRITFSHEPVRMHSRKLFWIVTGIGCALVALAILIMWIRTLRRRSG